MHPERTSVSVDVRSQCGKIVRRQTPVTIRWPKNTRIYIREARTTCATHNFLETADQVKKGDIFVQTGNGVHTIGTLSTGFVCNFCKKEFKNKENMLMHLNLPTVCVPLTKSPTDNIIRAYKPRDVSMPFQSYLDACAVESTPPYHLLPQLDAGVLRTRLASLINKQ